MRGSTCWGKGSRRLRGRAAGDETTDTIAEGNTWPEGAARSGRAGCWFAIPGSWMGSSVAPFPQNRGSRFHRFDRPAGHTAMHRKQKYWNTMDAAW